MSDENQAIWAQIAQASADARAARSSGNASRGIAARKHLVKTIGHALLLDLDDEDILEALQAGDPANNMTTYRWLLRQPADLGDVLDDDVDPRDQGAH